MNKEIEDALHMLLHCSLKDTEYETQVEQYNIVRNYITNLQQENKKLKERIEYLERSNNRREDTILEQRQEIIDLEYNWIKLKEYIEKDYGFYDKLIAPEYGCAMGALRRIKDKMQELEQGSDSNGR